jgi:hypothetical protein
MNVIFDLNKTPEYEYFFMANEPEVKFDIKFRVAKYREEGKLTPIEYSIILILRIYWGDYDFLWMKVSSLVRYEYTDFDKSAASSQFSEQLEHLFKEYDSRVNLTYLNDFNITDIRDRILSEYREKHIK